MARRRKELEMLDWKCYFDEFIVTHNVVVLFIVEQSISLRLHFIAKLRFLVVTNHGGNDVVAM